MHDGPFDGIDPADAERMSRLHLLREATAARALPGGITNRNYRVELPAGPVVVRLSDPSSSILAIERHHEYLNSIAAHEAGVGARVLDYRQGEGVLVVEWIEGRTLDPQDVADPGTLVRIAEACRRLHSGPVFAAGFDMFDVQARYHRVVRECGYRLPARYEDFAPRVDQIRRAMSVHAEAKVPCNNDLLAANFIDTGSEIRIIDYEYSGNNEASFELGNIWSESTLEPGLLPVLLEGYWGSASPALVARARLWALMSQYGWTLWASIQDATSAVEFDYWSWGMEKYERAVATFDGPEVSAWMDAVGQW